MHRWLLASLLVFCALAASAEGDLEVHAISVYEGNSRTGERIHGPEVRVTLDRPGQRVTLVLGSHEAVRWRLSLTPGTQVGDVFVHGHGAIRSEVWLGETLISASRRLKSLQHTYEPKGAPFTEMVAAVTEHFDIPKLASFTGAYSADPDGFVVNASSVEAAATMPELSSEPLAAVLKPGMIPDGLRDAVEAASEPFDFQRSGEVEVTSDGIRLGDEVIPATLDVPTLSWPTGVAHDPDGQRAFVITKGGEGFLYRVDLSDRSWSVLASMDQLDAYGLIYDPARDRVIYAGTQVFDQGPRLYAYDLGTGEREALETEIAQAPGIDDLHDPGNGPRGPLSPLAIAGDYLLLKLTADAHPIRSARAHEPYRLYVVDLVRGDVSLVGKRNRGLRWLLSQ